jgi:hypothetical protein
LATEATIDLHRLLAFLGRSRSFLAWYDVAFKIPYCQDAGAESSRWNLHRRTFQDGDRVIERIDLEYEYRSLGEVEDQPAWPKCDDALRIQLPRGRRKTSQEGSELLCAYWHLDDGPDHVVYRETRAL